MGTVRRRHALATALLMGLFLAGCAPAVTPTEPSPRPAPAKVSTPSPTPTPASPPRLPALGDLVITPGGIGSLRIGQPVSGTDMIVFDPDFCRSDDGVEVGQYPDGTQIEYGSWVPNYPTEPVADAPFGAHADDGVVTVIEVRRGVLATPEGIRIGSSLQSLEAAYPSLVVGQVGSMSKSLLYATAEGDMVFEVQTESAYSQYPPDTLINIRIFPPGQPNLGLVAGSDWVIGGCL